jgi:hypothetical protein
VRILVNLTLDYDGPADELRERLLAWGLRGGFRLADEKPGRWVLRRGSPWGCLFVLWDIHALYAEVEALHLPLSRQVAVGLECSSWFHFAAAGDRAKLEAELNLLRAFLVDAGGGRRPGGESFTGTLGPNRDGIERPGEEGP